MRDIVALFTYCLKRLGSFGETMEHRRYVITDDPQLQFVLIEIKLGITFVQTALNAYNSGHDEHGDSAKANAIKALESAKRFINVLNAAGQQAVRAELPKLEQVPAKFEVSAAAA
jgi:hypothetical protein